MKAKAKGQKRKQEQASVAQAVAKAAVAELAKLRRSMAHMADAIEAHSAVIGELQDGQKELAAKVKRLYADPIFSVPTELAKKVDAFGLQLEELSTKLAERAYMSTVDKHREQLHELESAVGAIGDRMDDLEAKAEELVDAMTAPSPSGGDVEPIPEPAVTPVDRPAKVEGDVQNALEVT